MSNYRKKVLITGGSGTVGSSFIENNINNFDFINLSRNEEKIAQLSRRFPSVKSAICDVRDFGHVTSMFQRYQPDIVIHAAALKHINLAEMNPTMAVEINIEGSLNVIRSSILANVPLTIGISTDKACDPDSIYGYTKHIMEKMFLENFTQRNKFICTRFANVANSNGSVIPFWKNKESTGDPLPLTDPKMNRLMFSKDDASRLVLKSIEAAEKICRPLIISKIMKTVNMNDLASKISSNIEIVGKRPGEKLNETLISKAELGRARVSIPGFDDYVFIFSEKTEDLGCILENEHSSLTADKMNDEEIRMIIG